MNALAVPVDEPRALAAQRLGNQEPGRTGQLERGRMKLHELEIRDARAGVVRERDAVAGGHRGIGRFAETPGRRRRSPAASRARAPRARAPDRSKNATPATRPSLDEQFGDERVIDRLDRRQRR